MQKVRDAKDQKKEAKTCEGYEMQKAKQNHDSYETQQLINTKAKKCKASHTNGKEC